MAMNRNSWTFCDGEGRLGRPRPQVTRRQALAAAASLATGGVWWAGAKSALAQGAFRADQNDGPVLVTIFLRGGADGLNIVAPYQEDDYYRHRPSLAIPKPGSGNPEGKRLTDLDGFFGLNPALLPLVADYAEGSLAFVHAVGSGDTTHSHFEAMSTMELGLRNQGERVSGGWLARHLNDTASRQAPLRAVAFGGTMPDSLSGAHGAVAINSLSEYRLNESDTEWIESLSKLYARGDTEVAEAGRDTLRVLKLLNDRDPRGYRPDRGATYPDSPLGKALKETAFLVKSGVGLEVACLDSVGWDSHITQGSIDGWLFELLRDLALGLAAFRTDLGKEMSRVVVTVQTEFGRRVAENSGLGTDHGAGGCMLALGGPVIGGRVLGNWPGLVPDRLSGPGDLAVTTDYRSVYSELLVSHLKSNNTNNVFPNFSDDRIGMIHHK